MPFKKCTRPCKYRSGTPPLNGCDYILITGKSRGCKAGEKCTKFEEGERILTRWELLPAEEKLSEQERKVNDYIERQKQRVVRTKNRKLFQI